MELFPRNETTSRNVVTTSDSFNDGEPNPIVFDLYPKEKRVLVDV